MPDLTYLRTPDDGTDMFHFDFFLLYLPDLTYLRTSDDGNGGWLSVETVVVDDDDVEHVFLTTVSGDFCG
jgi:hypothetical protein